MKKKISKLFHEFVSKYNQLTRKVLRMFRRKKKYRTLENHFEEPIYLLFPDEKQSGETKSILGFEGNEHKSTDKKSNKQ